MGHQTIWRRSAIKDNLAQGQFCTKQKYENASHKAHIFGRGRVAKWHKKRRSIEANHIERPLFPLQPLWKNMQVKTSSFDA